MTEEPERLVPVGVGQELFTAEGAEKPKKFLPQMDADDRRSGMTEEPERLVSGLVPVFRHLFKRSKAAGPWRPHEQRGDEGIPEREETRDRQATSSLSGTGGQCQQCEMARGASAN